MTETRTRGGGGDKELYWGVLRLLEEGTSHPGREGGQGDCWGQLVRDGLSCLRGVTGQRTDSLWVTQRQTATAAGVPGGPGHSLSVANRCGVRFSGE